MFINPVIIRKKGLTRYLEGCASCPAVAGSSPYKLNEVLLVGVVDRPYEIEVEYYTPDGEKKSKTIEGFEATVFSHEYDHLNGVLHVDLVKEVWRMDFAQRREYRNEHPYEVISKDCDFEQVQKPSTT